MKSGKTDKSLTEKNPPGARRDFVDIDKSGCNEAEDIPKCDVEGRIMHHDRNYGSGQRKKK